MQLVKRLDHEKAPQFTSNGRDKMNELTAASAQSVRLVVAFTKGRGTLCCLAVSWGSLLLMYVEALERTHLGLELLLHQVSRRTMFGFEEYTCPRAVNMICSIGYLHWQIWKLEVGNSAKSSLRVVYTNCL